MTNAESQRRYRMRGTKKQRELEERVARLEKLVAWTRGEIRCTCQPGNADSNVNLLAPCPVHSGDGATQDITLP